VCNLYVCIAPVRKNGYADYHEVKLKIDQSVWVVNWVISSLKVEQTMLLSWVSTLSIVACWRDTQHKHCIYCHGWVEQTVRHTTQALHLLWLIKSGANSVWGVECLHLVLSHAGETYNTSTASTAVSHWQWNKQYLFMLLLIEWSVCISLLVGETHNTSTAASTVTHWKWNKVFVIAIEWSALV